MEPLIGVEQVSAILGIKESTVRQWVSQKKIRYIKVGRLVKFRESDIEEYIKSKTNEPDKRLIS